jgi:uncharacterized protein (TIGR00725 family)
VADVHVAVVGPGGGATPEDLADAHRAGVLLARRGATVLTGGLDGVMAAAAEGVAEAGGTCVGLLPGDDRRAGSPAHTVLLPLGVGELRNALLVRCADAVLAIGGSWGTLSEIALARRLGRPLVTVRGWTLPDDAEVAVDDVDGAVDRLLARLGDPEP